MKLAELSTKVEEIVGHLSTRNDPHVLYLFGLYTCAFRAYHQLTSNIHHPNQVEVHPEVIKPFNAVYEAYLGSIKNKDRYAPLPVTFGDPLVVPTSGQRCRSRFTDANYVIKQRSRIKEGRNNNHKGRA